MSSFIDKLSWKYQGAIPVEIIQRVQGGELLRHSYRATLRHPSIRSTNVRMATSELWGTDLQEGANKARNTDWLREYVAQEAGRKNTGSTPGLHTVHKLRATETVGSLGCKARRHWRRSGCWGN